MPAPQITRHDLTASLAIRYDEQRSERDQTIREMAHTAGEINALVPVDTDFEADFEGRHVTIHGSAATTTTLDEGALRKEIGLKAWNKIVRKVVDQARLQAAIEDGIIPAEVVAKHTTITRGKHYPKVSVRQISN